MSSVELHHIGEPLLKEVLSGLDNLGSLPIYVLNEELSEEIEITAKDVLSPEELKGEPVHNVSLQNLELNGTEIAFDDESRVDCGLKTHGALRAIEIKSGKRINTKQWRTYTAGCNVTKDSTIEGNMISILARKFANGLGDVLHTESGLEIGKNWLLVCRCNSFSKPRRMILRRDFSCGGIVHWEDVVEAVEKDVFNDCVNKVIESSSTDFGKLWGLAD